MKLKRRSGRMIASVLSMVLVFSAAGAAGSATSALAEETDTAQSAEALFARDRVVDVKVTLSDEDWADMLANPLEKEYHSATIDVDGEVVENVGFGTKGNMTLNSVANMEDSDRYSFKVKFDKYDKTQTLDGINKLVLNNNYTDPSYLREYLHYEALSAIGLDAPRTVFVNLYINGELVGLYTGVEAVHDSYLEDHFGADYEEGVLYDTDEGSTLQYEEDGAYESLTEDIGTDENKAKLKNFIEVLNDMPEGEKGDIESVLDVDSALKYIAANAVLGNYDSYNGDKAHNYMLYGDADGKFTVIPWDFNMSFNGYSGGRGGGRSSSNSDSDTATDSSASTVNTNAVTASIDNPTLGIDMEETPMIANLLAVSEYNERYMQYVKELVQYLENLQDRVGELATLIGPYVEADPTAFYTYEEFQQNIAYSASEDSGGSDMELPSGEFGGTGGFDNGEMPEGFEPPQDGDERPEPGERPAGDGSMMGGNAPQSGGMGMMASGFMMTFALNRLVNLEEQLGLTVTELPESDESSATGTQTSTAVHVQYEGSDVVFSDVQPVVQSDQVSVPVYGLLELLNAETDWDNSTKTLTLVRNGTTSSITVGKETAVSAGQTVSLYTAATLENSRVWLSVQTLSDLLGLSVSWNENTRTLLISGS